MTIFEKIKSLAERCIDTAKLVATKTWQTLKMEYKAFREAPLLWLWRKAKALYFGIVHFIFFIFSFPRAALRSFASWVDRLTLGQVWAFLWRAALVAVVGLAVFLFSLMHFPHSQVPRIPPPATIVIQDQGWGTDLESIDRQTYYYTPQGTGNTLKNMRYHWLVNLEEPWGEEKLVSPDNMRNFGFMVDLVPTDLNPHHLPVGFTKHYDARLSDWVVDITCATCHTGELRVENNGLITSLRIDGGQGMHAFTASNPPHFVPVLIAAMYSTYYNPIKFDRFAHAVLDDHFEDRDVDGSGFAEAEEALKEEFKKTADTLAGVGWTEISHGLTPMQEGYARTDALTRIANAVFGDHITPNNYKPVTAPVSYPPVWDIWKFDWVQYSASVAQPMARNLGESLGVGASFSFFSTSGLPTGIEFRYETTTRIDELHKIEETLRKLRPPIWDEEYLPEIDEEKAMRGGIEFIRTCQRCHGPHPWGERQKAIEMPGKTAEQPHWRLYQIPVDKIGTDPNAAENFVELTFDLSDTNLTEDEVKTVVSSEITKRIQRVLDIDFNAPYPNPDSEATVHDACSIARPQLVYPESLLGNENGETGLERYQRALPENLRAACAGWLREWYAQNQAREKRLNAIDLTAVTSGEGLNFFGLIMREKIYEREGVSAERQAELNGFDALDIPQVKLVYKPRPLGGAWATAPYLHNGSVRTIYQLLSPQHERDVEFHMGHNLFDPDHLGLKILDNPDEGILLDTRISGNTNTGHEFRDGYTKRLPSDNPFLANAEPFQFGVIGPAYSHEQRMEIIEYLKVHLDDPPLSDLFNETYSLIVSFIDDSLPSSPENIQEIGDLWPGQQVCNLEEYLRNHQVPNAPADEISARVDSILDKLDRYFESPDSKQCQYYQVDEGA
ncbi:MAG: di-heme-cytochrome C peroxidase [Gammaproteobacteria bacterium]